jgi:ATP-dependent Clp protease adaptor protein ClpS
MSKIQEQEDVKTRLNYPKKYYVIMHNDDVTTMDFVVHVLRVVFFKSVEQATQLMLTIHNEGAVSVGTYSYDIAMSKAHKAMQLANDEGFPLRVTITPEESISSSF